MAKIGRSRCRAAVMSAISNSSRPGSASSTVACAGSPYRVGAAGQQQSVDAGERLSDRHRQVEDARLAADMEDRLPVIFELPARCDANHGHGYIRFGTSMPIRSSARVSCART
jgi:hypothetical protein